MTKTEVKTDHDENSLFWVPDKEDIIPLGDHLAVGRQGLVWITFSIYGQVGEPDLTFT